ncbi:hypothetical protein BJ138DRAFT_1226666 [Hygrophoropsis aurantiaca]|uniref:Uncharacterized protein n=1 Tax=Hygrophoropsis aurantiaca TaxID=72124 RepID=A0ACB7ZY37_9AGAM|nr:hypothetical protein BJ138DRAFT_1226666 [Hygrophoropsis aurantiaca]
MEKCKEYWDAHSVTAVFHISKLHNSSSIARRLNNQSPHFTDECGLGWSFAFVTGGDSSSQGSILFKCDNWESNLPLEIKSTVSLLEDVDSGDIKIKSASSSLSCPNNRPSTPPPPVPVTPVFGGWGSPAPPSEPKPVAPEKVVYPWSGTCSEMEIPGNLIDLVSYPFISITIDLGTEVDVDGKMKSKALKPVIQAVLQRGLFTGICFDIVFFANSSRADLHPIEPIYAYSAVLGIMQPGLLQLCLSANSASPLTVLDVLKRRECDSEISFDDYETDSDFDETEVEDREMDPDALKEVSQDQPNGTVVEEPSPAYSSSHNAVRTIRVNGVALKTLKALMYHCYTAEIFFSPLKSAVAEKGQSLHPERIYCSPKSMYRLADKLGSTELKRLSLQSIRSSLSKENILHEVFSPFTSSYAEVLKVELDYLVPCLHDSKMFQALSDKMVDVSSGAIPHSYKVLIDLTRRLGDLARQSSHSEASTDIPRKKGKGGKGGGK